MFCDDEVKSACDGNVCFELRVAVGKGKGGEESEKVLVCVPLWPGGRACGCLRV